MEEIFCKKEPKYEFDLDKEPSALCVTEGQTFSSEDKNSDVVEIKKELNSTEYLKKSDYTIKTEIEENYCIKLELPHEIMIKNENPNIEKEIEESGCTKQELTHEIMIKIENQNEENGSDVGIISNNIALSEGLSSSTMSIRPVRTRKKSTQQEIGDIVIETPHKNQPPPKDTLSGRPLNDGERKKEQERERSKKYRELHKDEINRRRKVQRKAPQTVDTQQEIGDIVTETLDDQNQPPPKHTISVRLLNDRERKKEQQRERSKKYRELHKHEINQRRKDQRKAPQTVEISVASQQNAQEKKKERQRKYREQHKEELRQYQKDRRISQKMQLSGTTSNVSNDEIFDELGANLANVQDLEENVDIT